MLKGKKESERERGGKGGTDQTTLYLRDLCGIFYLLLQVFRRDGSYAHTAEMKQK